MLRLAVVCLAVALPMSAAAQPKPTCTTAFGKTACGYVCKAAYGEVACAKTPWGACRAAFGKVVCSDGDPAWLNDLTAPPTAECVATRGEVACGWNCEAAFGQARCARRPYGTCKVSNGNVSCSTPQPPQTAKMYPVGVEQDPNIVRARNQPFPDPSIWPPKVCLTGSIGVQSADMPANEVTACGYGCLETIVSGPKCAKTPFGSCEVINLTVQCWDPPQALSP